MGQAQESCININLDKQFHFMKEGMLLMAMRLGWVLGLALPEATMDTFFK